MESKPILVWDLPIRVFHWLLALNFLGAFLTSDSERLIDWHEMFGYTMLGLIGFRLLWGIVGTRYARFHAFAFGPGKVASYLGSLLTRSPRHYTGHNPAGSWAIYAILVLCVLAGASGWAASAHIGGHFMEEAHEAMANTLMAVVVVHVAGVVVSSLLHGENLVRSMITGMKRGSPTEAIRSARPVFALLLALGVAAFWSGLL